ncbi:MAG: cyclic-di-AMP receptor [Clostridia bacterium]|nr:cyclic-di-AMP receptor [Clostridia bacterium]
MKLLIAIVQDEDASKLVAELMTNGYRVTKLATTGGFLRAGNTTLLAGVEEVQLDEALAIVEKVCKSRKQLATAPTPATGTSGGVMSSYPVEVTVGGATVFVMDVDRFVKF